MAQYHNPEVQQQLDELQSRLKGPSVRALILERVFSEADRQRVDEDELETTHIARIWARLRTISVTRAVLDLTRRLELLAQLDYEHLLEQTGEQGSAQGIPDYPVWDRDRRTLFFRNQPVRTVRSLTVATHVVAILDAFQSLGWPHRIASPLADHADAQRLREAVANLNRGLTRIRFASDGSGEGIEWRVHRGR